MRTAGGDKRQSSCSGEQFPPVIPTLPHSSVSRLHAIHQAMVTTGWAVGA